MRTLGFYFIFSLFSPLALANPIDWSWIFLGSQYSVQENGYVASPLASKMIEVFQPSEVDLGFKVEDSNPKEIQILESEDGIIWSEVTAPPTEKSNQNSTHFFSLTSNSKRKSKLYRFSKKNQQPVNLTVRQKPIQLLDSYFFSELPHYFHKKTKVLWNKFLNENSEWFLGHRESFQFKARGLSLLKFTFRELRSGENTRCFVKVDVNGLSFHYDAPKTLTTETEVTQTHEQVTVARQFLLPLEGSENRISISTSPNCIYRADLINPKIISQYPDLVRELLKMTKTVQSLSQNHDLSVINLLANWMKRNTLISEFVHLLNNQLRINDLYWQDLLPREFHGESIRANGSQISISLRQQTPKAKTKHVFDQRVSIYSPSRGDDATASEKQRLWFNQKELSFDLISPKSEYQVEIIDTSRHKAPKSVKMVTFFKGRQHLSRTFILEKNEALTNQLTESEHPVAHFSFQPDRPIDSVRFTLPEGVYISFQRQNWKAEQLTLSQLYFSPKTTNLNDLEETIRKTSIAESLEKKLEELRARSSDWGQLVSNITTFKSVSRGFVSVENFNSGELFFLSHYFSSRHNHIRKLAFENLKQLYRNNGYEYSLASICLFELRQNPSKELFNELSRSLNNENFKILSFFIDSALNEKRDFSNIVSTFLKLQMEEQVSDRDSFRKFKSTQWVQNRDPNASSRQSYKINSFEALDLNPTSNSDYEVTIFPSQQNCGRIDLKIPGSSEYSIPIHSREFSSFSVGAIQLPNPHRVDINGLHSKATFKNDHCPKYVLLKRKNSQLTQARISLGSNLSATIETEFLRALKAHLSAPDRSTGLLEKWILQYPIQLARFRHLIDNEMNRPVWLDYPTYSSTSRLKTAALDPELKLIAQPQWELAKQLWESKNGKGWIQFGAANQITFNDLLQNTALEFELGYFSFSRHDFNFEKTLTIKTNDEEQQIILPSGRTKMISASSLGLGGDTTLFIKSKPQGYVFVRTFYKLGDGTTKVISHPSVARWNELAAGQHTDITLNQSGIYRVRQIDSVSKTLSTTVAAKNDGDVLSIQPNKNITYFDVSILSQADGQPEQPSPEIIVSSLAAPIRNEPINLDSISNDVEGISKSLYLKNVAEKAPSSIGIYTGRACAETLCQPGFFIKPILLVQGQNGFKLSSSAAFNSEDPAVFMVNLQKTFENKSAGFNIFAEDRIETIARNLSTTVNQFELGVTKRTGNYSRLTGSLGASFIHRKIYGAEQDALSRVVASNWARRHPYGFKMGAWVSYDATQEVQWQLSTQALTNPFDSNSLLDHLDNKLRATLFTSLNSAISMAFRNRLYLRDDQRSRARNINSIRIDANFQMTLTNAAFILSALGEWSWTTQTVTSQLGISFPLGIPTFKDTIPNQGYGI